MKKNDRVQNIICESDFGNLTRLINEWDPVGLISIGAPEDEYNCLVNQVLSKLYSEVSVEGLENFLVKELNGHFGYSINKLNVGLKDFCLRSNIWFNNESCKKNELNLVRLILEKEVKSLKSFENYHGIKKKNIRSYVVEPFKVIIESDDNANKPYTMWIVMQENMNPHKGYVIVYDAQSDFWGVAEHTKDNSYNLVIAGDTLKEALERM